MLTIAPMANTSKVEPMITSIEALMYSAKKLFNILKNSAIQIKKKLERTRTKMPHSHLQRIKL
jgi:predicted RNA-binding protein with PIN domain